MIQLHSVKITVPLKKKFVVSKGAAERKTNFLAIVNNRYSGEASSSVYYGPSETEMKADLVKGAELLESITEIDLATLRAIHQFPINPIARSALVSATLNYLSGESRRYPWELLHLGTPVGIRSSVTVGIEKPGEMINAIKNSEYPIIKIKMGNEEDIMILNALDEIEGKEIRVDVNGAWSCAKAEEMIYYLAKKGVTVIEQPTDTKFVEEWQRLKGKNQDIILIMDEGMDTFEDYKNYFQFVDGVNIKMEKCGGILEGVRIALQAREDDKRVMLGCMVESSVGIAQSVYMSSLADYFDLDGPLLLENDIAQGVRYERESIHVDREIIGGPKLLRDVVEKYISE